MRRAQGPVPALLSLLALCLLLAARPCPAQTDLLQSGQPDQRELMEELTITLDSVGLANAARPGEWAGIRIKLFDRSDRQRDAIVRVDFRDADGDDTQYRSLVTINPSVEQPVWVYARLPFGFDGQSDVRISVLEALEGGEAEVREGALLARKVERWSRGLSARDGIIATVGRPPAGLAAYADGFASENFLALGHEVAVLTQVGVDDLPDRWMGLAMVRELIWTRAEPGALRIEQTAALVEWVRRGGHLVICLPGVGQSWARIENPDLGAILPSVTITREEGASFEPLRPFLTSSATRALPAPGVQHTFEVKAGAGPGEGAPILSLADGRCVVVSREVGLGAVTLVGIDVAAQALVASGMPEGETFWHRVLGRRSELVSDEEAGEYERANLVNLGSRSETFLDAAVPSLIAKSGRSLAGVMMGLIVFVLYWLVAGPGGFAALKKRGLTRHAWLAFLSAGIAFTALSWTGATILRPRRVEVSHLTFLDQVFGQRVQRVRSWMSVLTPVYGEATVELLPDDSAPLGAASVHAIAPWEPYRVASGGGGSFPDARSYPVDSRRPDAVTFPARATVKQLQADWLGGTRWSTITPVVNADEDPLAAIRRADEGAVAAVTGSLIHNLPGALEDVLVFVTIGQQAVTGAGSRGQLLSRCRAYRVVEAWAPGEALDLAQVTGAVSNVDASRYLDRVVSGSGADIVEDIVDTRSGLERLEALAFFNLLGPPTFRNDRVTNAPVARRTLAHNLDLSLWTMRPSVVVIGRLEGDAPMALPISVKTNAQERSIHAAGTTIVRWIYPLSPAPPRVEPAKPQSGDATGGG